MEQLLSLFVELLSTSLLFCQLGHVFLFVGAAHAVLHIFPVLHSFPCLHSV